MKWVFYSLLSFWLLLAGPISMLIFGELNLDGNWQTANRRSANVAPDPLTSTEAIIQVYSARTWSWRGAFAVHTWIAAKRSHETVYTVYQVMGWRQYSSRSVLQVEQDIPDRYWFGQPPTVLAELRGDASFDGLISRLDSIVQTYPYPQEYRMWPGPNSNTFTAFVARQMPELKLDLPPTAIGKDYLPNGSILALAPSGTGVQLSLYGLFGVILSLEEGIELNVLGLTLGIDPLDLALKLPGIGRVGWH